MSDAAGKERRPGLGVDATGSPVIDPTQNVKDLSEAANKRQDDLREAERRYNDLRDEYHRAMSALRAEHQKELNAKESSRLDSIRQVDREDVAKTAAQSNLAIATLAKQTTDLAATLQAQRAADMSEMSKRLSALELTSSATAGRSTATDPLTEALLAKVDRLEGKENTRTGFDAGRAALLAGGGLLGGGGLAALIMTLMKH